MIYQRMGKNTLVMWQIPEQSLFNLYESSAFQDLKATG